MTAVDAPTLRQGDAGGQKLWLVFTGLMLALLLAALDQKYRRDGTAAHRQ